MQSFLRGAVSALLAATAIWAVVLYLAPDTYTGFFYPDKNDLTHDIIQLAFDSLEACRSWAIDTSFDYPPGASDYECGLNCDLSRGKPFICEETVR